ncbi:MAG TPA: hypothetical protein VL122_07030 [Nitrospirota bacterium]|nr:hypothetical protein [Nitrospirota bacterium]
MILHPAIIALLVSSCMMSCLTLYADYYGILIIRRWDIGSGSGNQLELERRTYLISTILAYVFGFQLFSLFLFVYTADSLCPLFTGAMCAVGTLQVNSYGFPVLLLKLANFILAGFWLIINYADNRGYDYPLIRIKYAYLAFLTPLIIAEAVLQTLYFLGLHPDIITSCCGSLFSDSGSGITSSLSSFPPSLMKIILFVAMATALGASVLFYRTGKGAYFHGFVSAVLLPVALVSVISFIGPYIYELPMHHCPFCVLRKEYGYIGYPLYLTLLSGAVSGMGVGILTPFKKRASLVDVIPVLQKKLAFFSFVCYALFALIVLYRILTSNLVL